MKTKRQLFDGVASIGIIAAGLLLGGLALFAWFLWAIDQAQANDIQARAVTAEMHAACADLPRGSQQLEDNRHGCFKRLYGEGRYRITW